MSKINNDRRKKIDDFLKQYFKDKGANNIFNKKNMNLIENGILDSLDIVTLIVQIRKKFEININLNNQKVIRDFSTVDGLRKILRKSK